MLQHVELCKVQQALHSALLCPYNSLNPCLVDFSEEVGNGQ